MSLCSTHSQWCRPLLHLGDSRDSVKVGKEIYSVIMRKAGSTCSKREKEVRGSRVKKRCPYYILWRVVFISGVSLEKAGVPLYFSLSSLAAKRLSVVSSGGGPERAEEDQDEDETTLILPPDKDPATQHRTNSLIGKNSPNKQQVYTILCTTIAMYWSSIHKLQLSRTPTSNFEFTTHNTQHVYRSQLIYILSIAWSQRQIFIAVHYWFVEGWF